MCLSRSTSRTLRIDDLSAGIGNPALLQGLLIRRFDRRRERRSGRLHRLSAIIGTLSGLRRNPVRNASDSASETLDYEAELIFVVGKRAKHLTLENAYSCIAGYSCGNEGSVREYQRKTTQWDMGKNFDRTGGFGPWMVTADELPDAGKGLKIQSRLNGAVMQSDNTDNMMFPVRELLVYVTQGMTLEPGDIIFTGTPSGVGHARKPNPVWMKAGDTCEIDIEGVGVLVNPIDNEK